MSKELKPAKVPEKESAVTAVPEAKFSALLGAKKGVIAKAKTRDGDRDTVTITKAGYAVVVRCRARGRAEAAAAAGSSSAGSGCDARPGVVCALLALVVSSRVAALRLRQRSSCCDALYCVHCVVLCGCLRRVLRWRGGLSASRGVCSVLTSVFFSSFFFGRRSHRAAAQRHGGACRCDTKCGDEQRRADSGGGSVGVGCIAFVGGGQWRRYEFGRL